ncbi:uncharacterized protein A4U43_C07F30900 [Asparagus officinalis]|uniref:Uncharacterized protein n=1 Tax=Asparagus officinalis TaxID=4686 RepID=A0A5P1EGB0_ASPOF|nr:uncharacterized protein LOC109848473 [Asparagus officinalis]ONK64874.1 uncharacterized protein A4U43_C07F30900 [Asparagus officinalis]
MMQSVCYSPRPHFLPSSSQSNSLSRSKITSIPSYFYPTVSLAKPRYNNPSAGCLARVSSYFPENGNSPKKNEVKKVKKLVSNSGSSGRINLDPFRGKSGSVSFCGLTHENVEGRKLVSSPFKDDSGSFVWIVGPLALISSLLVPQFFLGNAIEEFLRNEILAEIVASFFSEIIFYAGLAAFLFITNHVQRPYLDFSPKQWSLITGLKGYLSSAFFTMGFKVFAPLFAAYAVWPIIGLPAAIAVAPFLLGCAIQFAFELYLEKRNVSCWPLLPIIFEVYRLYQLNKGAHFLERLMFTMREAPRTPELLERSGALFSMVTVLQVLGLICLWSLATFLLRLFPSRPVAENY